MSERHNSDGTAKSTTASKHALLLNRLVQMQDAPYYATAKDELAWAEKIITGQEDTIEQLQAELASVTAGKVTIVKEKFYPADKELIEQLQAEIEGLQAAARFWNDQANELEAENAELNKRIAELENKV